MSEDLQEMISDLQGRLAYQIDEVAKLAAACDALAVERNLAVQESEFATGERDRVDARHKVDLIEKNELIAILGRLETRLETDAAEKAQLVLALEGLEARLETDAEALAKLSAAIDATAVERNVALQKLEWAREERDALEGRLAALLAPPEPTPRMRRNAPRGSLMKDACPGAPRILFIGWAISSHTSSWIDLLEGEAFNARLFALPALGQGAPDGWPVPTYLTSPTLAPVNTSTRRTAFPPPPDSPAFLAYAADTFGRTNPSTGPGGSPRLAAFSKRIKARYEALTPVTLEGALAQVILEWRPDIVHTLGVDPASYLYFHTLKNFPIEGIAKWVVQARGGPDIGLNPVLPDHLQQIRFVLAECDHFVADSSRNYEIAVELGLDRAKAVKPGLGPVSGPGGVDIDGLRALAGPAPSKRERVIVWPKAYETMTVKALPVLEAIIQAWDAIAPCRIEMLWSRSPEMDIWFEKMIPEHIKPHLVRLPRVARDEAMARMGAARVMLAPSLADGVPNAMMEAMALGAVPIVSPLETITPVVKDENNVFFARNLYIDEIAQALVRAMTDDALVDEMAQRNLVRIRELAGRDLLKPRVAAYYAAVAKTVAKPRRH